MPGREEKNQNEPGEEDGPGDGQPVHQSRGGAAHGDIIVRMQGARSSAAVLLALALAAGCSDPPEPLAVDGNAITVINTTSQRLANVLIVVNDHYRGGVAAAARPRDG